jgi:phosphohistidine phosphatase
VQLLIIRHGVAMDRDEFAVSGNPDDLRPLTKKGSRRMKQVASGLKSQVDSIDHLATSPLTRACETAEIVADEFGIEDKEVAACLVPGVSFDDFAQWCTTQHDVGTLAIVGHEPHLSSLATWLLTGEGDSKMELRKGGACLIEFESLPRRDSGTLVWLLTPRQLRSLAR